MKTCGAAVKHSWRLYDDVRKVNLASYGSITDSAIRDRTASGRRVQICSAWRTHSIPAARAGPVRLLAELIPLPEPARAAIMRLSSTHAHGVGNGCIQPARNADLHAVLPAARWLFAKEAPSSLATIIPPLPTGFVPSTCHFNIAARRRGFSRVSANDGKPSGRTRMNDPVAKAAWRARISMRDQLSRASPAAPLGGAVRGSRCALAPSTIDQILPSACQASRWRPRKSEKRATESRSSRSHGRTRGMC